MPATHESRVPPKSFEVDVRLRFRVDVHDIDEDSVLEFTQSYGNREEVRRWPETWESMTKQRLLLHALLSQPDALRAYAEHFSRSEMVHGVVDHISVFDSDGDEYALLSPAVERLPDELRGYYEELHRDGHFFAHAELLYRAFQLEEVGSDFSFRQTSVEEGSSQSEV